VASGLKRIAIGITLWSTLAGASQAPASAVLSEALRAHLRDAPFWAVTSIRGFPLGVRDQLQAIFGGTLDIAEPGGQFRMAGRPADSRLPLRQMVAAGCSPDSYCLIYYERGGTERAWRVVLFHWTPAATRFEWGGTAPGGFTTIDAVRKAILSGAIKGGQTAVW
jgi:hypothetical protein